LGKRKQKNPIKLDCPIKVKTFIILFCQYSICLVIFLFIFVAKGCFYMKDGKGNRDRGNGTLAPFPLPLATFSLSVPSLVSPHHRFL
jgi:hypothetical protein